MPLYNPPGQISVSNGESISTLEGAIPTSIGQALVISNLNPLEAEFGSLKIQHSLVVGKAGAVDFTSIKSAVDYAISMGASDSDKWLVLAHPGTYEEDTITVPPGITVSSVNGQGHCGIVIKPTDGTNHLIELTGGIITGLRMQGVTDPTKALVHCATLDPELPIDIESTISNCIFTNAPTCILVDGVDVKTKMRNLNFFVEDGYGSITTGIKVINGAEGHATEIYIKVEPEVLSLYPGTDPIETGIYVSGAASKFAIASIHVDVDGYTANQAAVVIDAGAHMDIISGHMENSKTAIRVIDGTAYIAGITMHNNLVNVELQNSSSALINISTDIIDSKLVSPPGTTLSGILQDEDSGETQIIGSAAYAYSNRDDVEFAEYFRDHTGNGLVSGGVVTDAGGLYVAVTGGTGWVNRLSESTTLNIAWNPVPMLLLEDGYTNYVHVMPDGSIMSQTSLPSEVILLASVITKDNAVRYIHNTHFAYKDYDSILNQYLLATRKFAANTGLAASKGTDPQHNISVDSGSYYRAATLLSLDGYAGAAPFSYFYGAGGVSEVADQTLLDDGYIDSSGTLTAMTDGYFKADSVLITSDNRISVIYGKAEYETQLLAEAAAFASIPSFLQETGYKLANFVIEEGYGTVSVVEYRPVPSAAAGTAGGTGTSVHGLLSGLNEDDHVLYLLTNGTRALGGSWSLGGNTLTNAGTINGVDIESHGSRHAPGAIDGLPTGTPIAVSVGAAADEGNAVTFARANHQHGITSAAPSSIGTSNIQGNASTVAASNHIHDHGQQTDGYHHALVTSIKHGFMHGADKVKLDALITNAVPQTTTVTAGAGMTGGGALSASVTLNVVANADGSIIVNTSDIQVGVIGDTQHGTRSGGNLHPDVIAAGASGFMSGADKTKLNGLITNATPQTRNINTVAGELTGGGDLTADRTLGLAATGSAGSYSYVTFDAYGRETAGSLVSVNTTAPLSGGGDLSATRTLSIPKATGSVDGYLAQGDWTIFNNKQPAGSYITALTGDVTASGPGSVAATVVRTPALKSATTDVNVSSATAPLANQVLIATSSTAATWKYGPLVQVVETNITGDSTNNVLSPTFTDLLSSTITTGANFVIIRFTASGDNTNNGRAVKFRITVDGTVVAGSAFWVTTAGNSSSMAIQRKVAVTAGSHTIKAQWQPSANTARISVATRPDQDHACMIIEEVLY